MRTNRGNEPVRPVAEADEPIPGYRLIEKRGRGAGAEVWEAEGPGGFRVALKIVNLSTDRESGELRSLEIIRGIHHPNLLPIFGAWQVEKRLIIGMELADRSLWDRFLESQTQGLRGIPRRELLGYMDATAVAVDYLNDYRHTIDGRQRSGIQHRDLKPQNILLVGDHAKVADFGLARVMEESVASHTGTCTLAYAAPEFFGKQTSRQSDQYALAVTYCQLRGGRLPFPGTTAQVAVGHLLNEPDLDSLPEPERSVVLRALSKRPKDRWPDCRSFVDALTSLCSAEAVLIPDTLPRRDHEDQPGPGDGTPFDPSLLAAYSDFIAMDTGGSDFPVDLDEKKSEPVIPRQEARDAKPGQEDGETLDPASGLSPLTARSDFIPMDTGDSDSPLDLFETASCLAEYPRTPVKLGVASPSRWSGPETLPEVPPTPLGEPYDSPPEGPADVRRFVMLAGYRPDWSLISQYSIVAAIGLALLSWVAHDLVRPPGLARAEGFKAPGPDTRATPARPVPPVTAKAPAPPPSITATRPAGIESGAKADQAPGKEVALARLTVPVPSPADLRPQRSDPGPVSPPPPVAPSRAPDVEREKAPDVGPEETLLPTALEKPEPEPSKSEQTDPGSHPDKVESRVAAEPPTGGHVDTTRDVTPAGPPAPGVIEPGIDLPTPLAVRAGESATIRVRVRGVKATGPLPLEFRGLPAGVSAAAPAIPAGADRADVVLVASPEAVSGVTDATVAFASGAARAETGLTINVLPSPAAVAYQRGRAETVRGAFDRAVDAFSEAIRLDPGSSVAHRDRGVAHHFLRHYSEALADYSEAIRLRPEDPFAYLFRARVQRVLGENTRALNDYNESIRLRPDPAALVARGLVHHDLGDYDRATADFTAALQRRPDDLVARFQRGVTRYHSGDNAGAVADFTEVIRRDPKHAASYRCRGDIFARLGDQPRAGADHDAFQRLVATLPTVNGEKRPGGDSQPVQDRREDPPSPNPPPRAPGRPPTAPRPEAGDGPGLPDRLHGPFRVRTVISRS